MFTLKQLNIFRALMATKSATAAGRILEISQPAVSQQLAGLEKTLGLTLFYRDRGQLVPTPDADAFYGEAERTWENVERLLHTADQIRQARSGTLRIAAPYTQAHTVLPRAIRNFRKTRETVQISVMEDNPERCRELVAERQADLGTTNWMVDHPGCNVIPLLKSPLVCALPHTHPLCRKETITPQDLTNESLVIVCRLPASRMRFENLFRSAGIVPRIDVEVHSTWTAMSLVAEGVGITFINEWLARYFINRDIVLRPFQPALERTYVVITPKDGPISPLCGAFIKELQKTALELPDGTMATGPVL